MPALVVTTLTKSRSSKRSDGYLPLKSELKEREREREREAVKQREMREIDIRETYTGEGKDEIERVRRTLCEREHESVSESPT